MISVQKTSLKTGAFQYRDTRLRRSLYFFTVYMSEFAINKLVDRGSLTTRSIITNTQDFLRKPAPQACLGGQLQEQEGRRVRRVIGKQEG